MTDGRHPLVVLVNWQREKLATLRDLLADMLTSPETKVNGTRREIEIMLSEDASAIALAEEDVVGKPDETRCRSCKAPIIWITTKNGKKSPCNARRLAITTLKGETFTGFESHYATCDHAQNWRR